MLKNQNEDIKRMLGVTDDFQEPEKGGPLGRQPAKIGGPSTRLKPVVRQSSAARQSRDKLSKIDHETSTQGGGTPAQKRSKQASVRAASDSKFSASMSNMSKSGMNTGGFGANKAPKQQGPDSDLALEDYNELIEKMELDNVLEEVKKKVKAETQFRKSFLTTFFEETESRLAMMQHDEEFMKRPAMLKTRPENNEAT